MPTATPFNNLITFSRGSNATVTGSNGLIQWAPNNLLTFSEQFDNAVWSPQSLTVSVNTAVAPDGTTTADLAYPTSSGSQRRFARGSLPSASDIYTNSIYLKANGLRWVYMFDNPGSAVAAWFDVLNGVVGTVVAGYAATITSVGNGWFRCTLTNTTPSAPSFRGYIGLSDANNSETVTASGTNGVLFWGAQLELGSTATTYNPTTVKNLFGFSEAFDNAGWTKTRASIVTGAQANPVNGLFNAQKLMEDTTASNTHFVRINSVPVPVAPLVFSAYVKAAGRSHVRLVNASYGNAAYFTLTGAGSVGTTDGATGSITAIGDGWYRCAVAFTQTVATTVGFDIRLANASTGGSDIYTGDGNSGVYIYGAQLSDSASLDPYVPTPGAAPSSTAFYGPRFDFDPVTRAPRGLLVEEQRTNGSLYSEDLSNAYWTTSGASVVGGNVAPSGDAVAYRLVENTANAAHQIGRVTAVAAANATVHTMSFYVKAAGRTRIRLFIFGFNNYTAFLDLVSKTVVSATGGTAPVVTFTNVANGYIRIVVTDTTTASELQFDGVALVNTGTTFVYTGDGVSGVILWGFQREVGAFATSYIPTVASTVTRSADVALISGQNFGQWYGQPEGTFVVEYRQGEGTTARSAAVANDGTNNNTIELYIDGSTDATTLPFYGVYVGGVAQAALSFAAAAANSNHKMAGAYRTNDFAASVDGSSVATDTSGTLPTPTRLTIGANGPATGSFANGHIRTINFIPARAADFQLQAITTQPIVDYFFLQTATGDQLVDGSGDYLYSLPILG